MNNNYIIKENKKSKLVLLLSGLRHYFVILLFFVSIFSFFKAYIRKETYFASIVIFIFSGLDLFLNYYQIKKDNKYINFENNSIDVIKDGIRKKIKLEELSVGDLVYLEAGSFSLIEGKSADGSNEILIGDYIIKSDNYIVSKTGIDMELYELLNKNKNSSNDKISMLITFASLCMIIVVMILGLILKYDFLDILVLSLSLLIAIIPEGLILCKTFHLMNGNSYYKENNININGLNSLETLGKINILVLPEKYINMKEIISSLGIKSIIISNKIINVNDNKFNENMLNSLSTDELVNQIDNYLYFENMSVKSKLKIINAFKDKGYIVGIIGDNITDCYSMLECDVSISINNNDINNISDFIFPNIELVPKGIAKAQKVVETINKSVMYLLTESIIEGILVFFSIIFNTELFTNIQLLWLNLFIETTLAMLLSYDNNYHDLKYKSNFRIIFKIIFHSVIAIFLFLYYSKVEDILVASSMLFIYLVISGLVNIFSFKNLKKPILNNEIIDNKYLLIGILVIIGIQLLVFASKLSSYLIISGINLKNIFIIMVICLITFIIGEYLKPIYRKVFKV